MLKKYTAIIFMTVSYAILLGHSIIPHHHHHDPKELTEHHDTDHQHDGSHQDEGLNNLFSHFLHSADPFTATASPTITNIFFKQQLSFIAVLSENFSFSELHLSPLIHKPPAEDPIFISTHSLSSGLRAPPATFN